MPDHVVGSQADECPADRPGDLLQRGYRGSLHFWKHLRRTVTHTAFFQTSDRLLDAVTGCATFHGGLATDRALGLWMSRVTPTSCLRSREQDDAHPAGEGGCCQAGGVADGPPLDPRHDRAQLGDQA